MKKFLSFIVFMAFCRLFVFSQNLSLKLDGCDNNVRTGIGFLHAPWSLEAWVKNDDGQWKDTEVIFGGGEYSTYSQADNFPLVLKNGRPYNTAAKLMSPERLDAAWHHLALTDDGKTLRLYVDGRLMAKKDTTIVIIPGAIGVSEESQSVFGGQIDEVRVWNAALSRHDIARWMYRPLGPAHRFFHRLMAYYNFDEGIDDMALNWVGSGYRSYHLRNGRVDYEGQKPIACAVESDLCPFESVLVQRLFNAVQIQTEWDSDQGSKKQALMKLRVITQGAEKPLAVDRFLLDLTQVERLQDIDSIYLYAAGKCPRSAERKLLYAGVPQREIEVRLDRPLLLTSGANYFLVAADISRRAGVGDRIKVGIPRIGIGGKTVRTAEGNVRLFKHVTTDLAADKNLFRVLQWNIWHGGRHVPIDGRRRIEELVRASKADFVTMQEGYGFQTALAEALGYHLQTPSATDNLALFSRFPIVRQSSCDTYRSNPAVATLANGKPLLVVDSWLNYARQPDYTGSFADARHNPSTWIAQDSVVAMGDVRKILEHDVYPVLKQKEMPVIFCGDFNSCSHLDWTTATKSLHAGYGPVNFPTSRFMMEHGFKDSFRTLHPDELERPEGTFAGIYGQLDFSRIDFIYSKGCIVPVDSRIVQTAPEIDDIWASDHSAVLTTFRYVVNTEHH